MKYRKGFVTNSSSSSFIGTFAKITDKEKAQQILEKYNLYSHIKSLNEIKRKDIDDFYVDWAGVGLIEYESDLADIINNASWDDLFILWTSCDDYYKDEDYEDCDLSDFSKREVDIFNDVCEENGFQVYGATYGAGYNG